MALTQVWADKAGLNVSSGVGHAGTIAANSVVTYAGDFKGLVWIEYSVDAGTTWSYLTGSKRESASSFLLSWPDTTTQFRFGSNTVFGTATLRIGP